MIHIPAIESLAPRYGSELQILEANVRHTVGLVDGTTVIEVPTHQEVAIQDRFKLTALELLNDADDSPPLAIPTNPRFDEVDSHFTYAYIPGHTTIDEAVSALPEEAQTGIGHKLAEFAVWFGKTLDVATFEERLLPLKREYIWDENLATTLETFNTSGYPSLTRHANYLGATLRKRYAQGIHQVDRIAHDNLNAQNIILGDDGTPVGVIGMSYIAPGDLAREGRQLCRFGSVVANAYIERTSEITGNELELEHLRMWAATGFTLALCRRVAMNSDFDSDWFKNARSYIKQWYSHEDWSELDAKE